MSSPPHGRALTFPIVCAENRKCSGVEVGPRGTRSPSDEDVMAGLQANDSNALQVLFSRYSRLAMTVALGILHDRGEAEDIVQEVFFYIYQKAKVFDPFKGTAKAWIVQIVFHRALDRKAYLSRRSFYDGTNVESWNETLAGETDLDREVDAKLNREQLGRAFEELPEVQRRTLDLFYFEGFELREISEKLNEPLGNVRHHFYRGLERLRRSAFVQRLREK